jgi:anaerobic selenocysteine-containing dehydrogenase
MFDHGGSAGGYENTWGTGKLYFESMKVKHCRIHNRPAYMSEVHSTRDMGVDELNYAYADYEVTDTIILVGTNPMECQTNLFLNHMVKGMQNGAKVIIVDPRRTVTVDACEQVAGAENVLHLPIKPGSDLALFNTLFTYIADQGWVDADFIAVHLPGRCRRGAGRAIRHRWGLRGRPRRLQDEPCRWRRCHRPDRGADHSGRGMDRQAQGGRQPPQMCDRL